MQGVTRVVIPLLVAAATPAAIYSIAYSKTISIYGSDYWLAFLFLLSVFTVALLHAVILGLPAYFLVKHFNLATWWMSILCGGAIGMIPTAVLDYATNKGFVTQPQYLGLLSYAGFLGMSGGFAAWLTWYLLGRCMAAPRSAG
jgi:hypothetical protein